LLQLRWRWADSDQHFLAMSEHDHGIHELLVDVRERATLHLVLHGGHVLLRIAKVNHTAKPHRNVTFSIDPFIETIA
jgi:hypothetical protein